MKLHTLLITLLSIVLFTACGGETNDENQVNEQQASQMQTYDYTAHSPSGDTLAAEGQLKLEFKPASENAEPGTVTEITGTWTIQKKEYKGEIGPQTGSGKLGGSVKEDGSFSINLNPTIADQNAILTGTIGDNREMLEGMWKYETLTGGPTGPFKAEQQ